MVGASVGRSEEGCSFSSHRRPEILLTSSEYAFDSAPVVSFLSRFDWDHAPGGGGGGRMILG